MNIFKSLLVLLLLLPTTVLAEEVPNEVTINEDFSDSSYQKGLTISGGSQTAYIYTGENDSYNTTGNSLAIISGTYLFEFTEDVYEVGFMIGAVNNAYSVTWNYADNTSETENKLGQSTSNFDNMYDDFYKSFTDYNNDEANTDKFITSFAVTLTDISLLDTLYWQFVEIVVTTTSSTTTSSTTTTTSTTTCDPETQFELIASTATSDRVCGTKTVCDLDTTYIVFPGSATIDRVCAPLSECLSNEFEIKVKTESSDRACATISECLPTEYESIPPTATSDRVCRLYGECDYFYEWASTTESSSDLQVCNRISVCDFEKGNTTYTNTCSHKL